MPGGVQSNSGRLVDRGSLESECFGHLLGILTGSI
ncbi:hypothetical protein AB7M35_000156 [Amorphus suaedae]